MIGTVSRLVELEAALDRFLGVVVALADVTAARVARPVAGRRHVHVVHALAVLAHPPARDAVDHDLPGHLEVDRRGRAARLRARGRARGPAARCAGSRRGRTRRRADRRAPGTPRSRRSRSRRARARPRPCSAWPRGRTRFPGRPGRGTCHRSRGARPRSARASRVAWVPLPGALLSEQHEPRLSAVAHAGLAVLH